MDRKRSSAAMGIALLLVFSSAITATASAENQNNIAGQMSVVLPNMNFTKDQPLFDPKRITLGDFKGFYRVQISGISNFSVTEVLDDDSDKSFWELNSDGSLSMEGPRVQVIRALGNLRGQLGEGEMCGAATFTFQPLPEPAEKKNPGKKEDAEADSAAESDDSKTASDEDSSDETKGNNSKGSKPDKSNKQSEQEEVVLQSSELNETDQEEVSGPGASELPEIVLWQKVMGCAQAEMTEEFLSEVGQTANDQPMAMPSVEFMEQMGFKSSSQMVFDPWFVEGNADDQTGAPVAKLGSELMKVTDDSTTTADRVEVEIIGAPIKDKKLNYGLLTSVEVRGELYLPGSTVRFFMYSEPTPKGSATVSEDGTFTSDLEILLDDELREHSDHTLRIFGTSSNGVMWILAAPVLLDKPSLVVSNPASANLGAPAAGTNDGGGASLRRERRAPAATSSSPVASVSGQSGARQVSSSASLSVSQQIYLASLLSARYVHTSEVRLRSFPYTADSVERRLMLSAVGLSEELEVGRSNYWLVPVALLGFFFFLLVRRRREDEFEPYDAWMRSIK
jgi:hypothetical protein